MRRGYPEDSAFSLYYVSFPISLSNRSCFVRQSFKSSSLLSLSCTLTSHVLTGVVAEAVSSEEEEAGCGFLTLAQILDLVIPAVLNYCAQC